MTLSCTTVQRCNTSLQQDSHAFFSSTPQDRSSLPLPQMYCTDEGLDSNERRSEQRRSLICHRLGTLPEATCQCKVSSFMQRTQEPVGAGRVKQTDVQLLPITSNSRRKQCNTQVSDSGVLASDRTKRKREEVCSLEITVSWQAGSPELLSRLYSSAR